MQALAVAAALALAAPCVAQANPFQDRIVRQLQDQGFGEIRIQRTFLGRMRFVATGGGVRREIVINPNNGLILRDYWEVLDEAANDRRPDGSLVDPAGGGGLAGPGTLGASSSSGGYDDDDDDDHDRDERDRDDDRDDDDRDDDDDDRDDDDDDDDDDGDED